MTDNTETMNDILSRMPQTQDQLTREQIEAWLAGREEAGRVIDIETCELGRWYAWEGDPYDAYDVPPEMQTAGSHRYVRSPTSNGWISETDLPREKREAMYDRIERRHGLYQAACSMHPLWEQDVGHGICRWKGDGAAPSRNETIEWFEVNHPALARMAEREIRARIKEKREQADDSEWTPPF